MEVCKGWSVQFRVFRSKAFLFGVPGLVGLLWGWWVSLGFQSGIWFGGADSWEVGQIRGEFYAVWNSEEWPEWRDLNPSHVEVSLENAVEWKAKLAAWREEVPELRFAFVPYYWPVTGYVVGWAGLLIWRKRKFEMKMNE